MTYIDSAGEGVLATMLRTARSAQRSTKVRVRDPSVVRTFTLMGLMRAWDVQVEPVVT